MTVDDDIDKIIETYQRDGFCPVPVDHHPPEIIEALEDIGMVPGIKACFQNSQRFFLDATVFVGLEGLKYWEGYVQGIIPFEHAWLSWRGVILDLTIRPTDARPLAYLDRNEYSFDQVRRSIVETQCWGPVDQRALWDCHPHKAIFEQLEKRSREND